MSVFLIYICQEIVSFTAIVIVNASRIQPISGRQLIFRKILSPLTPGFVQCKTLRVDPSLGVAILLHSLNPFRLGLKVYKIRVIPGGRQPSNFYYQVYRGLSPVQSVDINWCNMVARIFLFRNSHEDPVQTLVTVGNTKVTSRSHYRWCREQK
jgi:hypothetical protein